MSYNSDRIRDLCAEHNELVRELHDTVLDINRLRTELLSSVSEIDQCLTHQLSRPPGSSTSYYWNLFGEHWRSFELFSDKITIAYQQLSVPFDLNSEFGERYDLKMEELWEDAIDEVDETLDQLQTGKKSKSLFMVVIDLIDSAERLALLTIPQASGKGKKFTITLQSMKRCAKDIATYLKTLLGQYGVCQIELSAGQYPPPETTRIISRNDSNTDDNVVVDEIILTGYRWQGQLLRKADVIVTSNEGA